MKLVLADHQHLVRHALRCYLETLERFTVLAEASESHDLARVVARLRPDVLLVDFEISPLNGADVARTIRKQAPKTAVVVLSRSENEAQAVESFRHGAAAFVTKGSHPRELRRAIEAAARGQAYISAPLSRRPLDYWLSRAARGVSDAYETLGLREREVLHLVSQGLSATAIARRLGIGVRTVETHRERVREKLGVRNTAGLVRYAVERQLFGMGPARRRP